MKLLIAIFIFIGAWVPGQSFAQDSGSREISTWEEREINLSEFQVEKSEKSDAAVLEDELLTTKKGRVYTLRGSGIDSGAVSKMREMTSDQQKNFQDIRLNILQRMAGILDSQSLTIGVGIATKNKLMGLFKKKDPTAVPQSVRELGMLSIDKILNSLNAKFWSESAKIADSKEVTFFMNPAGQFSISMGKFGMGRAAGVTFAIGYNKTTDLLFLDILGNMDKIRSGFVVFGGLKVLTGFHFDSSETANTRFKTQTGETFFPIILPAWEATGKDFYSFGVSTAIGLPPPPITDLFTYKMDTKRTRLLRLGITTVPLWMLVYNSLKRINAPSELLLKFAKKANMDLSLIRCANIF